MKKVATNKAVGYDCDARMRVQRIRLSDGRVLEGDAIAKSLTERALYRLLFSRSRRAEVEATLHQVEALFTDAYERRLTVDDMAVLLERELQDVKLDGLQAVALVVAGMRVMRKRRKGNAGSRVGAEIDEYIESAFGQGLTDTQIERDLQKRRGPTLTRQALSVRRKKRASM